MRFTVDSNVLVYAIDRDNPQKRDIALEIISRGHLLDMILTAQVLGEFINVMRRKRVQDWSVIVDLVESWTLIFPVAATSKASIRGAMAIAARYKLQWWDSLILEIAHAERVEILLSEDMQDGMSVAGVRLMNPFAPANADKLGALLGR